MIKFAKRIAMIIALCAGGGVLAQVSVIPILIAPLLTPITGALLLEDNVSFLLLEDNASDLCLEGGCIAVTCNGTLDLSTGCAQLVAMGGLF